MVLNKRLFRELSAEKGRYIALFLLVVFGMALSIGVASSSESILKTIKDEYADANAEDGEFSVFAPLSSNDITNLKQKGAETEKNFYLDFSLNNNTTLRVFKDRSSINKIVLEEGIKPKSDTDIVLEKNYAHLHGYSVGRKVTVGGTKFTVCGIGSVPDYNLVKANITDVNADNSKFSVSFVTPDAYKNLLDGNNSNNIEQYNYSYKLSSGLTNKKLMDYLKNIKVDVSAIKAASATAVKPSEIDSSQQNLLSFTTAKDNSRISAYSEDTGSMKAEAVMVGVIFIILLSYIISVFVIYGIEQDSAAIGTLYAMGYNKNELLRSYLPLPVSVIAAGGIVGVVAGFMLIDPLSQQDIAYYSFPALKKIISPYLLIYGIIMPIVISAAVNFIVIRKNLNKEPLQLLSGEKKQGRISGIKLHHFKFVTKFRIKQFMREIVCNISLAVGLFIALLIMLFGFTVYGAINNFTTHGAQDIKWDYMYLLKYPIQNVPDNSQIAYTREFKTYYENGGTDIDITLIGIKPGSKYFNFNVDGGEHDLYISSSAALKFGWVNCQKVVLHDDMAKKSYNFTIKKTVPYSNGLYVFMDVNSMRNLLGQKDDYYNTLISSKKLSINSNYIVSSLSKKDVIKTTDILMSNMSGMIFAMLILSIAMFMIVMYLLLKTIIDRSSINISLMKVFGYTNNEVEKLYINSNFYVVAVTMLIGIPLGKQIVNVLYPHMVTDIPAGFDTSLPFWIYVLNFFIAIATYFIVTLLLKKRIYKISPSAILKLRE